MSLHMNWQAAKGFNGYAMQHQIDSKNMYVLTHVWLGKLGSPRLNMVIWPMLFKVSNPWDIQLMSQAKGMGSIIKNSNIVFTTPKAIGMGGTSEFLICIARRTKYNINKMHMPKLP